MHRCWRQISAVTLLACFTAQLTGCSWGGQAAIESSDDGATVYPGGKPIGTVHSDVADIALQMIGAPYRYGGRTRDGFDCSGLVYFSYQQAGISVPRSSKEQLKATTPIDLDDARRGDLLFFRNLFKVSHVAIYLGDGRFVHAPSTGKQVSVASMDNSYYREHFVRAGRF
jgi:cell wall-associated NlpC family hydrolase